MRVCKREFAHKVNEEEAGTAAAPTNAILDTTLWNIVCVRACVCVCVCVCVLTRWTRRRQVRQPTAALTKR